MRGNDIAFLVIFLCFFVAGVGFGGGTTERLCRKAAIEAGVAEYTIDPKTGATSFVYKTCK